VSAYRSKPEVPATAAPIVWRPWMYRLLIVLVVTAAPVCTIIGWMAACRMWPVSGSTPANVWAIAALTVATIANLVAVIGIPVLHYSPGEPSMTPRLAMRLAWGHIIFPALGIAHVMKWIVRGSEVIPEDTRKEQR
jgi:hypothetical protein